APLTAAAYVVSTTTSGAEIKWPVRNVSYLINESSGPSGASAAIQAAMNTWSTVSGATFQFTSGGSTSGSGGSRDYQNICSFGYLGTDGTVAQNSFWANATTGVESESDIVFNTYYSWSVTGAAGAFDLQNIATHELGHALSLDDLYGGSDTEKTMYGLVSPGETKKRTLDSDDIAGIVYLYPAAAISLPEALDGSGLAWTTGGDAAWFGQTLTTHDGVDAARSGSLADLQQSWLETTVSGPGTLTFWWKVSSEYIYDFLRFSIGGAQQAAISGETDWNQQAFSIPSGSATLRWTYSKDSYVFSGQDAGWVDQVAFTPAPIPTVTLGLLGSPMAEAGGVATVTATLSAVFGLPVTVNLSFSGTATLTSDYTRSGTSITIPAGSLSRTITLTAVQDTLDEANETIVVDISTVGNGAENGTQQVTATIMDDDPTPSLVISDVTVTEGDTGTVNAVFTVTLSAASGQTVTVNYATANGTATGGASCTTGIDYQSVSSSLTFNPGESTKTITVPVCGDLLHEVNETFFVNLSGAGNATINKAQGIGTINDNDPTPTQPVALFSASPTSGGVPLPVTFTDASTGTITNRNWNFGDGSPTTNTTATTISHIYTVAGANPVTLVVTGPLGASTNTKAGCIVATNSPPAISVPPSSRSVAVGGTATFTVTATGTPPLSYQWRKDSVSLFGATGTSLTLHNVQTNDAGSYVVVVTNVAGSVTSQVAVLTVSALPPQALVFRQVSARGSHTVAVKADGTLWAWGYNNYGQLGDGTTDSKSSPVQVGTDTKWQVVAAGYYHTVAVKTDGTLWAWGYNNSGQLGDGTRASKSSPVQVGTDTNWQVVAAGDYYTVAVKTDGTLWAWVYNWFGQLGDGT
ncbi:MAG: immunoglobulin domain-containing protein, partial [Verrucomicrobia bacterium]|nr:immunoglobulin domain-containing protein [Verrucomicrobiota bacterium]